MDNEKIKTTASDGTDLSLSDIRSAKKAERKRKRYEKRELRRLKKEYKRRSAVIPVSKRPIICPPDSSDAQTKHIVFGLILRALVLFFAVAGFSFFVCESFGFDMTAEFLRNNDIEGYTGAVAGAGFGFIAPWALLFVASIAVCAVWKYGKFIGIPAIIGSVVILTLPNPVIHIYEAVVTAYNSALGHMKYMGFYAIDMNQIALNPTAGTREELVRTAVVLFTLLCALIFVPACIKRVRLIVPGIFSAAVFVFIFVYNLSRSNWALALLVASFAAIIVMHIYDRIFIAPPKADTTDDAGDLFGTSDEPLLPERLLKKRELKAEKKAAKKAARAEKRKTRKQPRVRTVEDEIDDYFADSRPAKPKKAKLTREQKLAAKEEKNALREKEREQRLEDKNSVRVVKKYRSRLLLRRAALGGLAGAGMFIVAFAAVFLPAASVTGSFKTIPAIDEKLEYYRDYVTAYLMGDDPALDLLAFEGNKNNFTPRDTTATPRYYTYTPLMTVESNSANGVYLRGWIGTDYVDGKWVTAEPNSELLAKYRSLFATNDDASESIYYNFFKVMTEDGVFDDDKDVTDSTRRLEKYGYMISQVNMKRTEDFEDIILYMPSFHMRTYSPVSISSTGNYFNFLRAYGSSEPGKISYANYFDGLYTSYRAGQMTDEGYAAVAMIPVLKNDHVHYNIADLITEYNRTRIAVANGRKSLEPDPLNENIGVFSVTLYNGKEQFYRVVSISEDGTKVIHIQQENGTAVYTIDAEGNIKREMINTPEVFDPETGDKIEFYAPVLDKAIVYFEVLDDKEQRAFNRQASLLDKYTPFVYDTYTKRADSQIIRDLYREIVDNAIVEIEYQDPIPADFSLAALKNEYQYNKKKDAYQFVSAITNRDVYVQRHELVMEIINYLCDEEKYTYTLTPTVLGEENTLNGVETFLTKTREGYCVQYASSLVLLLREAGIPARYVEGYIASGFRNNRSDDAVASYITTVRDNNAHAWVEVWYDGIGWVQYEATPEYYGVMYKTDREDMPARPPASTDPSDDPDEEEPEDPTDGMTDYEIEKLLEEQRKQALRALIRKIVIIVSVSAAVIAAIAIFFAIVLKRARKSERERRELLSKLYSVNERSTALPERAEVRRVGEMILKLLGECGYKPAPGEFGVDFALRIVKDCERELAVAAPQEGLSEFETPRHPMREEQVKRVFDAIAAEEFGNGAPACDLPLMARMYYRLHATLYRRRVHPLRRATLYLFKRES